MNLAEGNFTRPYSATLYLEEFNKVPLDAVIASYEAHNNLYDVIVLDTGVKLYHTNMKPSPMHTIHNIICVKYNL